MMPKQILVLEDEDNCRRMYKGIFCYPRYHLQLADNLEEAKKLIKQSEPIFDLAIVNPHLDIQLPAFEAGLELLEFIQGNYPSIARIVITGRPEGPVLEKFQERFDIDELLVKASFRKEDLEHAVDKAINKRKSKKKQEIEPSSKKLIKNTSNIDKGEVDMIIEFLTTTTIATGVKFLFDQLGKLTGRMNEEQLARIKAKTGDIEKASQTIKTDQDIAIVQNSMNELMKMIPEHTDIISIPSFTSWAVTKIDEDFDNLIGIDELIVVVLRKKGEEEPHPAKSQKLLKMEAKVKTEIAGFKEKLSFGEVASEDKEKLYMLIRNALNLLKNS